jgi:hypothetical protein
VGEAACKSVGLSEPSEGGLGSGEGGADRAPAGAGPGQDEVWLLQAEAAELAGCSVSAIRKWRREGSVNFRRTTTPGGLERVEVRLGDVLTRAGTRAVVPLAPSGAAPVPQQAPPPLQPPVAGTVVVSLADLQTMFGRIASPGGRPDDLKARYRSLESEVSFMRGELARLVAGLEERAGDRRRADDLERRLAHTEAETARLRQHLAAVVRELEKARRAGSGGNREASRDRHETASEHGTDPAPPVTTPHPPAHGSPAPASPTVPAAPAAPRPSFEDWLEVRPAPDKPSRPAGPPIERLADELRRLYQALASRPRTPGGAEERARWAAELRRYDTVLVKACSGLGVTTEHRPGDRLTAPERVALTRALADAGLDVRRSPARVEG